VSIRSQRVSEEIRKVISERLIRGIKTPLPGFVTISAVEVNSDLTVAKIFYSVFGSEEDKKGAGKALEEEKRALRYEVAQKVRLRLAPELVFVRDDSPERAARISELLQGSKTNES